MNREEESPQIYISHLCVAFLEMGLYLLLGLSATNTKFRPFTRCWAISSVLRLSAPVGIQLVVRRVAPPGHHPPRTPASTSSPT
jgi:hypothetical protein